MCRKSTASLEERQPQRGEHVARQRVGEIGARERLLDHPPQGILGEPGGRRIHRRERFRDRRLAANDAIARVNHLRPEEALPHFAERAHVRAGRELLHLTRIELEEAQRKHAAPVFDVADELAPWPVFHFTFDDASFDEHILRRRRLVDAIDVRFVVVAQRQMKNEIERARNTEPRELVQRRLVRFRTRRNTGGRARNGNLRGRLTRLGAARTRGGRATIGGHFAHDAMMRRSRQTFNDVTWEDSFR